MLLLQCSKKRHFHRNTHCRNDGARQRSSKATKRRSKNSVCVCKKVKIGKAAAVATAKPLGLLLCSSTPSFSPPYFRVEHKGMKETKMKQAPLELPNFALVDHPTLDSQIFLEKWFHSNFQNIFCRYLTLDTYLKLFFAPRRRRANGLLQRIFALP